MKQSLIDKTIDLELHAQEFKEKVVEHYQRVVRELNPQIDTDFKVYTKDADNKEGLIPLITIDGEVADFRAANEFYVVGLNHNFREIEASIEKISTDDLLSIVTYLTMVHPDE